MKTTTASASTRFFTRACAISAAPVVGGGRLRGDAGVVGAKTGFSSFSRAPHDPLLILRRRRINAGAEYAAGRLYRAQGNSTAGKSAA
jgi:hypothetical protein